MSRHSILHKFQLNSECFVGISMDIYKCYVEVESMHVEMGCVSAVESESKIVDKYLVMSCSY